ncbi:MAG TPA: glycosyltransferase family A protein [Nakamurella sp.]
MGFGRIRRHPRSAPRRGSVLPGVDTHVCPRYSVVIPAFNEQAYLGACLASLASQDYPGAFEVIVVDNNSTDDTAVIAAAAGVTVVVEPERGVCQARQRGTEVARGEIVISTDADTTFPPGWLSGIDAAFARHPGAVAVAGPCHFAGAPRWGNLYSTLLFGTVNLAKRVTGRVVYVSATNIAFRRSAWTGYDTRLTPGGDELDLLRRLQAAGEVVFDSTNPTRTSSRRLNEGLLYNVAVTFFYYYLLGYALNRTFRRPVLGTAPAFRRSGDRGPRMVTGSLARSWRMARAAFLLDHQPPE